jgi:hypothetical protein
LLYPADFPLSEARIVGAENVYPVLAGWLARLQGIPVPAPPAAPARSEMRDDRPTVVR